MHTLVCQYCDKAFQHYVSKSKFCSRECYRKGKIGEKRRPEIGRKIAEALRGQPLTEERKQNISRARIKYVSQTELDALKEIWSKQYITDAAIVCRRSGTNLSNRVYHRVKKDNVDFFKQYPPLMFLPMAVQEWPLKYMEMFLEDAQTIHSCELAKKYDIGEKTAHRILKHFGYKWKSKRSGGHGRDTEPENVILGLLKLNQLNFQSQVYLEPYFFDFVVGKYVIEIHGDYWHCNPELYPTPIYRVQRRNMINDAFKRNFIEQHGYQMIVFWENDIKNNREKIVCRIKELAQSQIYSKQ